MNYFKKSVLIQSARLIAFLVALALNGPFYCSGQDTIYRTGSGNVAVFKTQRIKVFNLIGERHQGNWLMGQVRKVNYEYSYIPTYNGSTQPVSPSFYNPVKVKNFYYVPADDIVIKYDAFGQVFQTFSKDSSILRSFYKDGTPRDIYFFNDELQLDSLYKFYENGNLKTKFLGSANQMTNNLVLNVSPRPEMKLRAYPLDWEYRANIYRNLLLRINFPDAQGTFSPKVQYQFHGNGNPQIKIEFLQDSTNPSYFTNKFTFYDLNGKLSDSANISADGAWTGVRYKYYDSGIMESKSELFRNVNNGAYSKWNRNGELEQIAQYNNGYSNSTTLFKQLKDTLVQWHSPMHFEWYNNGALKSVKHKHCSLEFKPDSCLFQLSFKGFSLRTDRKPKDERMDLEHFGEKNQFGLPHGRWYGVNKFNDTIYDINYEHGWLHGNFDINVSYWPSNWVRTYDMGVEIDSSYRENKGERNRTLYFASPGKLSKQIEHFVDGRIHRVDTVLYAQKLTPLKTVRFDGWTSMIASVDSAQKILHTKRYFAPDSLEIELWTDYAGNKKEWKQYHKKNGALKIHWILNGIKTIEINGTTDEYDTRGNLIGTSPRTKTILLATRFTYDLSGQLIKTENLVDGNPEP